MKSHMMMDGGGSDNHGGGGGGGRDGVDRWVSGDNWGGAVCFLVHL